jgi:hypothetical protein
MDEQGKIVLVRKATTCAADNCPALYRAPGGYITVGRALIDAELAEVSLGPGETAVFVPADVIED